MGLFDVGIKEEISSKKTKKEILHSIEKNIENYSNETSKIYNDTITLNSFKSSILRYDLSINIDKSNNGFNLSIHGELQQFYILIFLVLIILSILFTFGIGVIFIVIFAFLQKKSSTKSINTLINNSL